MPVSGEALKARRKREWERKARTQEILPDSRVFLSFTFSEDTDEEIERGQSGQHEFGEYDFIVKVRSSPTGGVTDSPGGKTLSVMVPQGLCHDHGMPHLSKEQIQRVWAFLSTSSKDGLPNILISTTRDRAVDAVAIAVGYLATKLPASSPEAVSCESECFQLPSPCEHSPHINDEGIQVAGPDHGPVHNILAQIHDCQDDSFEEAWMGVISREGVEWLEDILRTFSIARIDIVS